MKNSRVKYEVDVGNKESCLSAPWQEARKSKCTPRVERSFLPVSSFSVFTVYPVQGWSFKYKVTKGQC